jgi:hypothetical protein
VNFQSYYLTVDRCTTYSGAVCTACLPAYYLVTISPNNACQLTTEFAPGYGITSNTSMTAQACSTARCTNCWYNYLTCTQCDSINGWYLNGNTCQHAWQSPVFPNGKGPNTGNGLVETCTVANCLNCSATIATCIRCNTAGGYYLNTGANQCQHATIAPIMPSGYGPNTATGTVVACSDTRCLLCKTVYTTCTGCDTGSQWYLNTNGINQCQHPTSTPQIPDFYGANTGTGSVVACNDVHCKTCKPNYLTCTACDTTNGWFLDGNVCEHATVAPIFPTRKGPNTSSGLVVSCQDANCLTCSASYTTCQNCDSTTLWYLQVSTGTCLKAPPMNPSIPAGFGPNLGLAIKTVVSCLSPPCVECYTDYSICTFCASGYGVGSGTCTPTPPCPGLEFVGPSFVGSSTHISCSVAHCKYCCDCLLDLSALRCGQSVVLERKRVPESN